MAEIAPTVDPVFSDGLLTVIVVTWLGLKNGDTGAPYALPGWADRNVQADGTFGTGGHLKLEGSNFGRPAGGNKPPVYPDANAGEYAPLTGSDGLEIDFTAQGIKELSAIPLFVRPVASGDETTDLLCKMLVRSTR
jgi:hypothetical protein